MNMPAGVELHGKAIRISFLYRGVRCREVLRGWTVTNSNLRKAGNLRAQILCEIQQGKFNYAEHFPESKAARKFTTTQPIKTFGQLCDVFLSSKKHEVSESTYINNSSKISTLKGIIGENTLIAEIRHTDLLRYRGELLTGESIHPMHTWLSKNGRAASTVNGLMSLLCSLLRLAYRSHFIDDPVYEGISSLKKSRNTPDPLLPGEFAAFLKTVPEYAINLWILAVYTGLRHGEICSLAWEDIDLVKGEIRVCRNITNRGVFVPPKTDAGIRTITLLKPALDALRNQFTLTGSMAKTQIQLHHREYGKTEQQNLRFVFVPPSKSRKKAGHYFKSSLSYSWEQGIEKAKLRYRVPYQTRHTFACWALTAGANPSFIASQLGHENAKMIYEVYGKWIGELNRNQVDMLNDKLQNEMPQMSPICSFVQSKAS
ncbi:TPA: tyrosine-type recombinase/integrase [Klebsiella aerogenes]